MTNRVQTIATAAASQFPWFTQKADEILARIKTDTTEDVMLYHDAVSVLVAARTMYQLVTTLLDEPVVERAAAERDADGVLVLLEDAISNIDYPGSDSEEWTHKATSHARALRSLVPGPVPADPADGHDFIGVLGHPDDDECTHRSDGTDATYCGLPASAHNTTGEPAPADEREALVRFIESLDFGGSWFNGGSQGHPDFPDRPAMHRFTNESAEDWADKFLAAGFRRKGPIADTEWMWFEFEALAGQIDNLERSGPAALPVFFQRTRRIRDRAEAKRAPLGVARGAL